LQGTTILRTYFMNLQQQQQQQHKKDAINFKIHFLIQYRNEVVSIQDPVPASFSENPNHIPKPPTTFIHRSHIIEHPNDNPTHHREST
jgi:hypothetical protein